jgi:hypothetical protein
LKTVADADDDAAAVRKLDDFLHDGRESRDGAAPEIVAVRKSARQNYDVAILNRRILVPEENRVLLENFGSGIVSIVIAIRSGKNDNSEL